MRAEFRAKKDFKQPYGAPPPGQFALDVEHPQAPHWDHCREQFAPKWDANVTGFYFSIQKGQSESVAGFICKAETVLNLENLKTSFARSAFSKTDRETVMWIEPSLFWRECEMRRSLFTILIRCGMIYDPDRDDFEQTLFGDPTFLCSTDDKPHKAQEYARETRLAVQRFFFGFTKFVKQDFTSMDYAYKTGWHTVFREKELATIRKMLVLPDGEESFPTLIGVDSLWA
jgi:hypothetical protein